MLHLRTYVRSSSHRRVQSLPLHLQIEFKEFECDNSHKLYNSYTLNTSVPPESLRRYIGVTLPRYPDSNRDSISAKAARGTVLRRAISGGRVSRIAIGEPFRKPDCNTSNRHKAVMLVSFGVYSPLETPGYREIRFEYPSSAALIKTDESEPRC